MNLTPAERAFLTALAREHNQTGCRGPAHDRLRREVYPDAPPTGPGSLAFAYDVIPLTNLLLKDCPGLQEIDDFLRRQPRIEAPVWPWDSAEVFRGRLKEARRFWARPTDDRGMPAAAEHPLDAHARTPTPSK